MSEAPVPGVWVCRRCNLKVHKRALYMKSATVGVDARLVRERCMNGCGLMVQATEKDMEWKCPMCDHPGNSCHTDVCSECGADIEELTFEDFKRARERNDRSTPSC